MKNKIYDKYFVLKNEDIEKYLAPEDAKDLKALIQRLAVSKRCNSGEKDNTYLIVNTDERYAELVKKLILGEITANEIIETIARNCTAWDTSKDKKEGLLPEVAVFRNPHLYKQLTGEEYNFRKACQKYHIGED